MNNGTKVRYKGGIYVVEEDLGEGLLMITMQSEAQPFKTILPGVQVLKTLVVDENLIEEVKDDV